MMLSAYYTSEMKLPLLYTARLWGSPAISIRHVDAQTNIGLHAPYWRLLAEQAAKSLARVIGQSTETKLIEGVWTLRAKGQARAVLTHPLWALHHPHLRYLATRLRGETTHCTLFDALHRPGWCVSQMGS